MKANLNPFQEIWETFDGRPRVMYNARYPQTRTETQLAILEAGQLWKQYRLGEQPVNPPRTAWCFSGTARSVKTLRSTPGRKWTSACAWSSKQ